MVLLRSSNPLALTLTFLNCCFRAAHFPTLDSFSWFNKSISSGISSHFWDFIEIPAKRLRSPKTVLVPGKNAALEKPYSDLYQGQSLLDPTKTGNGNYAFGD